MSSVEPFPNPFSYSSYVLDYFHLHEESPSRGSAPAVDFPMHGNLDLRIHAESHKINHFSPPLNPPKSQMRYFPCFT